MFWAERERREGEGETTVNVFQNDVTWNNDAKLKQASPHRPSFGFSELPNLS